MSRASVDLTEHRHRVAADLLVRHVEDAIVQGIARANETLDDITGAWIQELKVDVVDGRITAYRVNMKVTFVLHSSKKGGKKK